MPIKLQPFLFPIFFVLSATLTGCGGSTSPAPGNPAPPPAAPDFSLTVSPSTLKLVPGTNSSVAVLATASGGFSGTVALSLSGLPSGVTASPATLVLGPGTSQAVNLAATAQAALGSATVTFTGTSGSLTHTASLALNLAAATVSTSVVDVPTYHYNNARDGLNAQETALTVANVNSKTFGLVANYAVDGKVDAEPLYLSNVALSGGPADILYAATEHGTVFAFNAATGATIWKTSTLRSGETTSDNHGCDQISPEIGITSTPVIDRNVSQNGAHGTIFVVAMSKDTSGNDHQRLHALDLTTGTELSGSPTEIAATYPGSGVEAVKGSVVFDPGQYAERVGLLLLNGTIYTAWTSHCDSEPYTGWVLGYDETSLQQTAVLNLTPNGSEGAVWMSGFGLAADASSIYFLDANGTFDDAFDAAGRPDKNDYGNAMVKLSTAPLAVADFFEPYNTAAESAADIDLGSGGAMLLPDLVDSAGKTRHLVVGAGKDTNIYLADRDNMGKLNQSANNSNLYQELPGALVNGAWSGPAFFNNTLYYAGVNDALKAFPVANALLATTPSSKSSVAFPYPGSTPAISANGTRNGIVWALESSTSASAVLHAYDATNLANELYNSNQAGSRDAFGKGNKFITPMIVNGRVYIGTPNSVAVFGLLNP